MILERINSPQDLKTLTVEQLNRLCGEIRCRMIDVVSQTGGHLASSLGAVELIIALHYCLNTPQDKIIFDVGHQSYAHKIITGRNKNFDSLRQYHGLSGFPSKDESAYDPFTTGHSSTAVSLALGLVCARDLLPEKERFKVAAVIGDGSLSGGVCFEGLNNAGHLKKDLIVVLNTNELSIAPNVGAISTYLNKLISLPVYNRFHDSLEKFLTVRGERGKRLLRLMNKFEESLKGLFVPGMLFEEMGFRYFGPIDGHNLNVLISTLKNISGIKGPRLLHVVTKKGKGCQFAEQDPVKFHGISCFDPDTGLAIKKTSPHSKSYTAVFGETLVKLAAKDRSIVAITAAMPEGTGLDKFRDAYPERFFDVGIAEGHAVSFAAGLARQKLKPVVAIYSTFLQRAYDQIIEDVALQELPVVFAIDRAGIVGEDGVTHQGIFDISYLSSIPNLVIIAPKDGRELEGMLAFALSLNKPVALRYARANIPAAESPCEPISLGKAEVLREGNDFVLFALGSMVDSALKAADILNKQGISGAVINARFVRPLDSACVKEYGQKTKFIFTLEEAIADSGFGSIVALELGKQVIRLGLPRDFIEHASRELLLEKYGLQPEQIAAKIKQTMRDNG